MRQLVAGGLAAAVGVTVAFAFAAPARADSNVDEAQFVAAINGVRARNGLRPLATDGQLHPMQRAFQENHGLQCGYCTPGMVMAAVSLLEEVPNPTERQVREGLEGNLCRCTGYHNIVKSVLAAAGSTS